MEQDLLGNALFIGARCLYLKAGTQVNIGLVEVIEIKETGVVCKVINSIATVHTTLNTPILLLHISRLSVKQ